MSGSGGRHELPPTRDFHRQQNRESLWDGVIRKQALFCKNRPVVRIRNEGGNDQIVVLTCHGAVRRHWNHAYHLVRRIPGDRRDLNTRDLLFIYGCPHHAV